MFDCFWKWVAGKVGPHFLPTEQDRMSVSQPGVSVMLDDMPAEMVAEALDRKIEALRAELPDVIIETLETRALDGAVFPRGPKTDGDDIPSEEQLDAAQAKMGDKDFRSLVRYQRWKISLRQRRDRIGGRAVMRGLDRRARENAEQAASSSVGEEDDHELLWAARPSYMQIGDES